MKGNKIARFKISKNSLEKLLIRLQNAEDNFGKDECSVLEGQSYLVLHLDLEPSTFKNIDYDVAQTSIVNQVIKYEGTFFENISGVLLND